jgi:hypothetical protein
LRSKQIIACSRLFYDAHTLQSGLHFGFSTQKANAGGVLNEFFLADARAPIVFLRYVTGHALSAWVNGDYLTPGVAGSIPIVDTLFFIARL